MELLKIENGYVQCQGLSKIALSSIKKASYEKVDSGDGAFHSVVLKTKDKKSISWVFEKGSEAKEICRQLQSKLQRKTPCLNP